MPWLELRSGAPGLDGPFLLENRLDYQVFDENLGRPDIFMTIGGKTKRRFLRRLGSRPSIRHDGVVLEELLTSIILIDCELHDATLPRIKAGPRAATILQHHLKTATISDTSSPRDITESVFRFLWQVLVPFSSTVVIFLDDIGGLTQLSDILAAWATRPIQSEPSIVILHDAHLKINQAGFETVVWRKLLTKLPQTGLPESSKSLKVPFKDLRFLPIDESAAVKVLTHVDSTSNSRRKCGLSFRSEHIKDLLHQSILQFAAGKEAMFDFYATARRRNPVPDSFVSSLSHFVNITRDLHIDQPSIIASALALDALPPEMHYFPPGAMFDHFYRNSLETIDERTGMCLTTSIQQNFIQFLKERRGKPSAQQHLSYILTLEKLWKNCHTTEVCLVCLSRRPRRCLSCGHRLCDTCMIICNFVSVGNNKTIRQYCPLCHEKNYMQHNLRPPTAGLRALKIVGESCEAKFRILNFIEQLQHRLGLPLHALRDQFDLVMGTGIGAYFVQTIFVEHWTIAESRHHLRKLAEPKITRNTRVSFGKGLDWDLDATRLVDSTDVVLVVKNDVYSNAETIAQLRANRRYDVKVRCGDVQADTKLLDSIANRMIASLFYIELLRAPTFYSVPEDIYLRLRCRVPTGLPLINLLYKLRLCRAKLLTRTTASDCGEQQLVTTNALQQCKVGKPFSRLIKLEILSHVAKVNVQIRLSDMEPYYISNCPYSLQDLIQDSKLDCVFGRQDHQISEPVFPSNELALEEVGKLEETVLGIIGNVSRNVI